MRRDTRPDPLVLLPRFVWAVSAWMQRVVPVTNRRIADGWFATALALWVLAAANAFTTGTPGHVVAVVAVGAAGAWSVGSAEAVAARTVWRSSPSTLRDPHIEEALQSLSVTLVVLVPLVVASALFEGLGSVAALSGAVFATCAAIQTLSETDPPASVWVVLRRLVTPPVPVPA